MGSELSCPCRCRDGSDQFDNNALEDQDIIQEVMKGKLQQSQIFFEHYSIQDDIETKVCLISSYQLENFFSNRNLLVISSKKEKHYYFNHIFITNFLNKESMIFILLQFKPTSTDNRSSAMIQAKEKGKISSAINDYNGIYLVETINFVSNDEEKIKEQILNDLKSKLKREFLFFGIVNDPIIQGEEKNEVLNNYDSIRNYYFSFDSKDSSSANYITKSNKFYKNFRIIYKKSKISELLNVEYSIFVHDGDLNHETISSILEQFKQQTLKAVMKENVLKNVYYFIFEEKKQTLTAEEDFDYFVCKLSTEKHTADIFIKDITGKLNEHSKLNLTCVINDDDGVFLIFKFFLSDLAK